MANDPSDLIREADEALTRDAANEGGLIIDDPADLVRRLRDALADSDKLRKRALRAEDKWCIRAEQTLRELRKFQDLTVKQGELLEAQEADLAEANATIERVRALVDRADADLNGLWVFTSAIRRAIEGKS